VIADKLFCSPECKARGHDADTIDHVQQYSMSLLLHGLEQMAFRAAIRSGHGEEMIEHWRINMLQFGIRGHWKYLRNGHDMLIGKL
jgi:hypothetical protein